VPGEAPPLASEAIARFFTNAPAKIENNIHLRIPQEKGHAAAVSYFQDGGRRAVVQIPVGCGKTGLITLLPFGIAKGRVLVIAPNLTIRRQLADAFDFAQPECFYRRTDVLAEFSEGPYRVVLDADANLSDCDQAHVVVTNIQQLAERATRWLPKWPDNYYDLIVVDEGHHNAAPSWRGVFERFPNAKVISLTATPFRADEQPIEGETIYRYSFREAMQRGYIKMMEAHNVAPREIYFTYRGDDYHHTLEEVMQLREEDWFSRGVALAKECNISIVDASILWLQSLRETGSHHQLIAVACSLDHARQIRGLFQERGLNARDFHSGQTEEEQGRILLDLKTGVLDVIVQVQMLAEGFDHPPLSIAAVFRPFRSLSPYIQFVGRVMRVNKPDAPGDANNRGIVMSHVGMNIDRRWEDFKALDAGDQEVIHEWLTSTKVMTPTDGEDTTGADERRRLGSPMHVTHEVVDRFISDAFLDPNDYAVIDNALTVLRQQGLDLEALGLGREALQQRLRESRASQAQAPTPTRLWVQPQEHRKVLRDRLNEQVKSVARRICDALGEHIRGQRIALLGSTGASNNLTAVIVLMNHSVNDFIGIQSAARRELSTEELERVIPQLDDIGDGVQTRLREQLT
jgi:DNA repair protein RadD